MSSSFLTIHKHIIASRTLEHEHIFGQLAQAIVEMEIGLCSTSKVVVSKLRGDL